MPRRSNGEPEYRRRIREKTENSERQANCERNQADEGQRIERLVTAISSIAKQQQRSDNQRNRERQYDRLWERAGVVALVAAAVVGLIAIYVGNSDAEKARVVTLGQLDVMAAAQRPWIAIDGDHHDDLSWDERGARLSVYFKFENVGKSPAVNVYFQAKAVLPKIGEPATPVNAMMDYLAEIDRRRASSNAAGEIYFPNHIYKSGVGTLIDRPDFESLMKESKIPDVIPRIVACVSYQIYLVEGFKHTCTSYYVMVIDASTPTKTRGVALNENVTADHIGIGTAFYSYAD